MTRLRKYVFYDFNGGISRNLSCDSDLFLVLLEHRYRESGTSEWKTIPVTPSGSTTVTINNLTPSTLYEFQVIGKNALGEGMLSKVITVRTLGNETALYSNCSVNKITRNCVTN